MVLFSLLSKLKINSTVTFQTNIKHSCWPPVKAFPVLLTPIQRLHKMLVLGTGKVPRYRNIGIERNVRESIMVSFTLYQYMQAGGPGLSSILQRSSTFHISINFSFQFKRLRLKYELFLFSYNFESKLSWIMCFEK